MLLSLLLLASRVPGQQANPLQRLSWLAGCWQLERGSRTTIEMWMPPAAGLMLGASRTVVGRDSVREFEHVRLRADGEQIVFTALPSGQREASFRSSEITDSSFTVENPAHDFPQRIMYRRRGADSLIARIEGGGRGVDFPYRRVSCSS